ncbi:MAG: hypothetical protein HOO90_04475 [Methylotenera sp.]|uniref:hypothetical protein n=1 Tax=Methylotenera sp. TaxID=2051956 RepID=UPI0018549845|nr:hypothetical protein [Methylotenera sp.]NOU24774.1 hypothetical protein [Methylotenera sp.]
MRLRHFAAIQYAILAIYLWASWLLILSPPERAIGQLEFMFAPTHENRTFFIFLAIAPIIATALSISFCFQTSNFVPLANWLAAVAFVCFVVAVWQFDSSLILGFGLGFAFAVYSRLRLTHHSSGTPNGAP